MTTRVTHPPHRHLPDDTDDVGMAPIYRNLRVNGRRTSVRMEAIMWAAFADVAKREQRTLHDLTSLIDRHRLNGNLTAAIRVFILCYFWEAAEGDLPDTQNDRPIQKGRVHRTLSKQLTAALSQLH